MIRGNVTNKTLIKTKYYWKKEHMFEIDILKLKKYLSAHVLLDL